MPHMIRASSRRAAETDVSPANLINGELQYEEKDIKGIFCFYDELGMLLHPPKKQRLRSLQFRDDAELDIQHILEDVSLRNSF